MSTVITIPTVSAGQITIGSTEVISGTVGSVLFIGASGLLQEDNANFFWDDTANELKVNAFQITGLTTGVLHADADGDITSSLVVNADVSASAAIAYSKLNLALSIVNGDISASAAIARSKVAVGTANHVVINDGTGALSSEASLAVSRGGTGLTALGTANQLLGVNAGATAGEYKTLSGTSNQVTVTHGAGTVTLAAPQNIHTAATPTFSGLTLSAFGTGIVHASSAGLLSSSLIVNADVSGSAAIAYSKLNLSLSILNADVSASAAIARSKLASGTANQVIINDGAGVLSSEAALAATRGGTAQTTWATGDLMYASAANTLAKRAVGASGQVLKVELDGTTPTWHWPIWEPREYSYVWEEFVGISVDNDLGWTAATDNDGIALYDVGYAFSADHPGVWFIDSGTLATFTSMNLAPIYTLGGGALVYRTSVHLFRIGNAPNNFNAYAGMGDTFGAAGAQNAGVYFSYEPGVSPNWIINTAAAGVVTATATATAVAANTWYRLEFRMNAGATSVQFFIDGTSVGTHTTNIPATVIGQFYKIDLTAYTDTTSQLLFDYMDTFVTLTNNR